MLTPATHLPARRSTHRRHQPASVSHNNNSNVRNRQPHGFVRYDMAAELTLGLDNAITAIGLVCDDLTDGFPVVIQWFHPQQPGLDPNREAQWIRQLVQAARKGMSRLKITAAVEGLDPRAFLAATACLLPEAESRPDSCLDPVEICLPLMGEEAALRLRTRGGGPARLLTTARSLHIAGWKVQLVPMVASRFPGWKQDWLDSLALARYLVPALVIQSHEA
jgi:hypothetical protein